MSNKMISLFHIGKTEQIGQQTTNNYGLDEETLIENARKNLHEAVTEEYISAEKVGKCCTQVKDLLPEDALANFYETAVKGTPQELTQYLLALDCHSFELSDLEEMVTFLTKALKPETCNPVAMFIDRIGGADTSLHERVATRFDEEAQKVDNGIYDSTLPRDVFVAYRSADMKKVVELVDYLENTEGLECFVSYRNLQHGSGAKDHYDEWLKAAMDSCKVLVFVSSVKSRREGDARHKELPYVKKQDQDGSPREYQAFGDYTKIPKRCKKPRVEYLIESYTAAKSEGFAKEFFDGFTRRESPEAVAQEIFRILDFGAASLRERENLADMVKPAIDERAEVSNGAEDWHKAEKTKTCVAEKQRKEEEIRGTEKIKQEPWLAPGYPTLENYDKSELEIEETVLKKYLRKEVSGEVKIPFGVTSIEDKAFEGCGNLTSIIIPSSVTEIKAFAFAYCSGLTSITILDGVTLIDSCAFRNCIKLTSIKIPNSVKTIGYGAFMACSELISITIGSSVTEIGENSFADCNQLKCIQVATESTVYKSEGNCLIDIKSNQLVLGCGGSCIPEYVTSIGPSAFRHGGLTSITIPNSVTSIWQWAFANCRGLTSIAIPESVTAIGAGAFCSCSGLTSVFIPKSVTRLGEAAFERCGNLKIYCAAKEQPQGWEKNWNPDNRPVVWSYNKK